MRILALLALLALPLAACGGSGTEGKNTTTQLEVTVWPAGKTGPSTTHTMSCPGDSGCARLVRLPAEAFDPVPAGMACTEIYGGPDEAHVQGTLRGQPVDASFKRTDGCEIARWTAVAFLLGRAGDG